MKASLLAVALLATATTATSQFATGTFFYSRDSDAFEEFRLSAGFTAPNGFGLAAGALRFAAPGWTENGALLAGTYKENTRTLQIDASLGVLDIAGQRYGVGGVDYLKRWESGNALGVSVERDIVNSQGGIQDQLLANTLVLVGDYVFSPSFNVGLAGGATYFTGGNMRPVLRTRWNYALDERYGLNAYLKTRSYTNSDPDQPQYFSPARLNEASLGLSSRWLAAERVVFSASIDAGTQITGDSSEPIWSAILGLASPRQEPIRWNVGLLATNTSSLLTAQSGAYRYVSLVAQMQIPF